MTYLMYYYTFLSSENKEINVQLKKNERLLSIFESCMYRHDLNNCSHLFAILKNT